MIEHLDGHTDIVHMLLYHHWLPWSDSYPLMQFFFSLFSFNFLKNIYDLVLLQGYETKRPPVTTLLEKGR